jgi:hypothetical protein
MNKSAILSVFAAIVLAGYIFALAELTSDVYATHKSADAKTPNGCAKGKAPYKMTGEIKGACVPKPNDKSNANAADNPGNNPTVLPEGCTKGNASFKLTMEPKGACKPRPNP